MRIMEMVSGAGVNGAVMHCLELTRLLAGMEHDITLVCRPKAWIARQPLPKTITIVESTQYPFSLHDVRELTQLIKQRQIQLIHTHQSRANFTGVVLRQTAGVPSIATAHNRLFQLHWMWNDYVIGTSAATLNFHRRFNRVSTKHSSIIPCFVDFDRFRPATAERKQIARAQLDLTFDQPVIGMVGHAIRRKGVAYLVEALPAIMAKHPRVQVLVVGTKDRKYMRTVFARAEELGVRKAIRIVRQRTDIENILPAFDIFVLPTLEDQIPIAISEAMASGLPIVATRVGGIPECVRDGIDGWIVPRAKAEPLAEALLDLLDNPAKRAMMGAAARERAEMVSSPVTNSKKVEAVFEQVLESRRQRNLPAQRRA